jgi:hypothetical protein
MVLCQLKGGGIGLGFKPIEDTHNQRQISFQAVFNFDKLFVVQMGI